MTSMAEGRWSPRVYVEPVTAERILRLAELGAELFATIDKCYDRHRRGLMTRAELVDAIEAAAVRYQAPALVVTGAADRASRAEDRASIPPGNVEACVSDSEPCPAPADLAAGDGLCPYVVPCPAGGCHIVDLMS